jgi:hypothetical protein
MTAWADISVRNCIGCGFCCRKAPCVYGTCDPGQDCKHLFWDGQRWRCHLIAMSPPHAAALYAGDGCCCGMNTFQREGRVPTPDEVEELRKRR